MRGAGDRGSIPMNEVGYLVDFPWKTYMELKDSKMLFMRHSLRPVFRPGQIVLQNKISGTKNVLVANKALKSKSQYYSFKQCRKTI